MGRHERPVEVRRPRAPLDEDVYQSEVATNLRNRGIAHLLESYGRLYFDPDEATDVYTRQCSLLVTAEDLAVMGCDVRRRWREPADRRAGRRPGVCRRVLAVMATAGLYELSGDWLYEVGLPGKSGVSGGSSPSLPARAVSARSHLPSMRRATACAATAHQYLSERLGLNLFASATALEDEAGRARHPAGRLSPPGQPEHPVPGAQFDVGPRVPPRVARWIARPCR